MRLQVQFGAVIGHRIPESESLGTRNDRPRPAAFGRPDLIDESVTTGVVGSRKRGIEFVALYTERRVEQSAVLSTLQYVPMVLPGIA